MLDNLNFFFLPCSFIDLRLVIPEFSVIPEVFSDLAFLGSQSRLIPPPYLYSAIVVTRQVNIMIKKNTYDLQRWKGRGFKSVVFKARAVNVLHCICVSGHHHRHHHHHHHYHYHHYYCISTQATSIIKRALIGLACVAWAGNYLITGRARGTREGERRPPLLFSPHASSTLLLSPILPPPKQNKTTTTTTKLAPATQAMIGPTLKRLCVGQSKERDWRGRTRGGGDEGLSVLHWFFYNEFEDAQEQAPTQVQWHNAELTVKWHLTDRLLSPMRTYGFLGYLLLEPQWSPTQRSIFARCIAAQRQAELY